MKPLSVGDETDEQGEENNETRNRGGGGRDEEGNEGHRMGLLSSAKTIGMLESDDRRHCFCVV